MLTILSDVPDYRRLWTGNLKHKCKDILLLYVMGTLSKCVTRADIIRFAEKRLHKFQSMGILMNGVPSEPTLCRFDKGMNPDEMAKVVSKLILKFPVLQECKWLKVISIDGKCTRGTVLDNGRCPDIVSAYSVEDKVTIGTEMCEEKSNEIKAVPKLIDKLDIDFEKSVITADAMSCQKKIIDSIRAKGGHFLIEVKENQKALRWDLEDNLLKTACLDEYNQDETLEHGRIESRTCRVFNGLEVIADKDKWGTDLKILEISTKTTDKKTGVEASERRFYITDLDYSAKDLNAISRAHWGIESMHWILDCDFHQDNIKRKSKEAARNLDSIQRFCLSLISIWKRLRKKKSDKSKGVAEFLRNFSLDFTALLHFLALK